LAEAIDSIVAVDLRIVSRVSDVVRSAQAGRDLRSSAKDPQSVSSIRLPT
jgi:hypothetical protein